MATPADALARLLEILDRVEIPYFVGGSVASSAHGVPRATMDVDLVADLKSDQVDEFVAVLEKDFYVDAHAVKEALGAGRSFNLIHFATAHKFDLFPLRRDAYSRAEFARRKFIELRSFEPQTIECAVATAEDTILRKLEWYRQDGEVSERQWNDLRGILKVRGAGLDLPYLRQWAPHLQVTDLLERLLAE